MDLRGKKVAMFIADYFEDIEFWYPYYRLKEAGADVVAIGPRAATYHGKHGLTPNADRAICDAMQDEFLGLIIPGGYSPDHMRRSPEMVQFVREIHAAGKTVAAICHGPWMLASAGVIGSKQVTSFFSIKDDLIHAGAEWIDREVVCDGNIITSRRPDDLPAFCKAVIAEMGKSSSS
jgi:protease I